MALPAGDPPARSGRDAVRFSVGLAESDIAVSRAFGALRVVAPRREVERDEIQLDISCINSG